MRIKLPIPSPPSPGATAILISVSEFNNIIVRQDRGRVLCIIEIAEQNFGV